MGNRLGEMVCVVLVAGVMLGGCKAHQQEETVVLAQSPDAGTLGAPSDFATPAIDAAGGLDAWTTTKQLQLDCVVTFFGADGAYYLTEQSIKVYPWSNALEISASEPQGEFVWRLSSGRFEVVEGAGHVKDLPVAAANRCASEAILEIVMAPARLLDKSAKYSRQSDAVQLHGQWYYPIDSKAASKAVFYQDRDNSVVDMIQLACKAGSKTLTVRGYDYVKVEKDGPAVPRKIEIFSGSSDEEGQKRLVTIDCHRLTCIR